METPSAGLQAQQIAASSPHNVLRHVKRQLPQGTFYLSLSQCLGHRQVVAVLRPWKKGESTKAGKAKNYSPATAQQIVFLVSPTRGGRKGQTLLVCDGLGS